MRSDDVNRDGREVDFQAEVLGSLRRVGGRLKRYVLVQGACRLAVVMTAAVGLHFGVDRLLVLGIGPRVVLLLALLCLLGHRLWVDVLRAARVRVDVNDVAALVERRNPVLNDLLVSAVAYATGVVQVDSARESPAMVAALIDQSARRFKSVRPEAVLHRRRQRRHEVLGLGVLAMVIGMLLFAGETVGTYVARDLLLADVPWPSRTRITVEGFAGGRLRWPIGDDLTVVAKADGEVPRGLIAEFAPLSGGRSRRGMDRRGLDEFILDYGPLGQSMKVRFLVSRIGADEPTEWYRIEAVNRPSVREVSVQIQPPSYTGQSSFVLPSGQTSADILRGSRVRIEAVLNKPVASAVLRCARGGVIETQTASGDRVSATFEPPRSGMYFLDLVDRDGFDDKQPVTYGFRLLADPSPKVRLSLPGTGEIVTAGAALNLAVECEDDLGLRSVELAYRVVRGPGAGAAVTSQPAAEFESLAGFEPGQMKYTVKQVWPLSPLSVHAGDEITLQVVAADYQPAGASSDGDGDERRGNQGPSQGAMSSVGRDHGLPDRGGACGQTVAYTLRVVRPEELLAELGRREHEWRREFEQIIKAQEQIQRRIVDLRSRATGVGASTRYAQEARTQRQQIGRLKTVRGQFEGILAELRVNRLAGPKTRRRLDDGVIVPMGRLIGKEMEAAVDALSRLGRGFAAETADDLEQSQARIVRMMYSILSNLVRWEGYNEAVSLLQDILRLQEDIHEDTRARLEREIEELFGEEPARQPRDGP